MSDVPLPQPDAYEYLIAGVWRTETHFNGVKAKDHRCLYATEKVHAHAAAVSAAENARLREALELIAAPMRPDGTWNRERLACQQIAVAALKGASHE
jgi:hypothetical protein